MAGLKVITPPAIEPVTLPELKQQLRIDLDDTSYDAQLIMLITAAREWCEGYQNRAYITQTLELALDTWPCGKDIELPRPEVQSITSLTYTDGEGATKIWPQTSYLLDSFSFIPKIVRASGVSWPSGALAPVNGVKVRYVAGYPPGGGADIAASVPKMVKQAIILLATHWFENGMCDPPPAVLSLLNPDRVVPV